MKINIAYFVSEDSSTMITYNMKRKSVFFFGGGEINAASY